GGDLLATPADLGIQVLDRVRDEAPSFGAAGGAPGHECDLAPWLHGLHAGGLSLPDYAGVLVAAPRPPRRHRRRGTVGAAGPGLLLPSGQPGPHRAGPRGAGPSHSVARNRRGLWLAEGPGAVAPSRRGLPALGPARADVCWPGASGGADAPTVVQPDRSVDAGRLEEPVDLGRSDYPGAEGCPAVHRLRRYALHHLR